MKRRLWLPLVLGIPLLVFFLGLAVPARLLAYFVNGQALQLSAVSGTVRDGVAARALLQTPGGYFHLGELKWSLEPLSIFSLVPKVALSSAWGDQRAAMTVGIGRETLRVSALDMNVNAALLKQALPVELQGRLSLLFDELLVAPPHSLLRADGRLVWQGAAWASPSGVRVLGNYAATFSSPALQRINVQIETLSGPVVATGTVSVDDQRYAVDLYLESQGQAFDPELGRALSLIASPEENGYRLRLDGDLTSGF